MSERFEFTPPVEHQEDRATWEACKEKAAAVEALLEEYEVPSPRFLSLIAQGEIEVALFSSDPLVSEMALTLTNLDRALVAYSDEVGSVINRPQDHRRPDEQLVHPMAHLTTSPDARLFLDEVYDLQEGIRALLMSRVIPRTNYEEIPLESVRSVGEARTLWSNWFLYKMKDCAVVVITSEGEQDILVIDELGDDQPAHTELTERDGIPLLRIVID